MGYKDIEREGFLFVLDEKKEDAKVLIFKNADDGIRFLYMVNPTKDMTPDQLHQRTVANFFAAREELEYEGKTKEDIYDLLQDKRKAS